MYVWVRMSVGFHDGQKRAPESLELEFPAVVRQLKYGWESNSFFRKSSACS